MPRTVSTCRCGAALPPASLADDDAVSGQTPVRSDFAAGFRVAIGFVVAIGAIGLSVYWVARTPPADQRGSPGAGATPGGRKATALAVADADTTPTQTSEQKRWPARALDIPVSPAPVPGAPPALPVVPAAAALEDVVGRAMPAVVQVETPSARGSGFYVRPDTLLTNAHVVESYGYVTIRRVDGSTDTARVESRSPAFDIAVLRVSSARQDQPVVPLGSSTTLRVGQEVFTIGSPLGTLQNTVTRGIVSGLRQSGGATLVQTDAAANPGNSGGPLIDRAGMAVGITTMGYKESQGLNFAVAIEHARAILEGRSPATITTGASAVTTNDIRGLSPAIESDTDRMRMDGERVYASKLEAMARVATGLDGEWRRFRQSCYESALTGSFDREWFALLTPGAMPGPVSPQCATYLADFQRNAESFRTEMLGAGSDARRAGVYPGVLRDTRRKYQIDHDAWR